MKDATIVAASPVLTPAQLLLPTPFVVVVDTREQAPYQFAMPLRGQRGKHFAVQTTRGTLPSGDYSLAGFESRVAVERKSLNDLFGTLGSGRARFTRELERMALMEFTAVVVEADWATVMGKPPVRSRLRPKTVFASVVAWQQRFPRTHWWFAGGRDVSEAVTVRVLERFWREQQRRGGEQTA